MDRSSSLKLYIEKVCDMSGVRLRSTFADGTNMRIGGNRAHDSECAYLQGAWIGAGATILPSVTVGENTIVGADSIVNKMRY